MGDTVRLSQREIERRADDMDREVFSLIDRAETMYDKTMDNSWLEVLEGLRKSRRVIRSHMSKADREATS